MDNKIKIIDPSQIRYTPDEGEIIQTPDGDYLIYKDNTWNKVNYEGSDINLDLYDMNKQIISQLPILTDENLIDCKYTINYLHTKFNNQFYMLYGKEISYFTLFQIIDKEETFGLEVIDCLKNVGDIKAIDMTENEDAVEIWVMDEDNATCLYLFPYDSGLVRIGE